MSSLVALAWFLLILGLALAFLELILPTGGILLALGGTAAAGGIVTGFFDMPSTGWTLLVTTMFLSPVAWFAFSGCGHTLRWADASSSTLPGQTPPSTRNLHCSHCTTSWAVMVSPPATFAPAAWRNSMENGSTAYPKG